MSSLSCRYVIGPLRNPAEVSSALKLDTEWKTISRTVSEIFRLHNFIMNRYN